MSNEPIALPGDGLDVAGFLGVVAEGMAKLTDGGVDAVLGVDEDLALPKSLGNFFAGGKLSVFLCQQDEQFERLAFNAQAFPAAYQLEASAIQTKIAEFVDRSGHEGRGPSGRSIAPANFSLRKSFIPKVLLVYLSFTSTSPAVHCLGGAARAELMRSRGDR
jgi:hypothetical protein